MKWFRVLLTAVLAINAEGADSASSAKMDKLVHALSGVWRYGTRSPASSQHPKWHGHGRGIEIWRTTSGGAPLVEENHMTIDGKESYDYAGIWWNGKAQNAQGIWCDAEINDQGCTGFAVTWKGEQIVMSGEYESGGKRFAWRETLERKSEDSLTQTLHIGQSAGELKLVSTTALTKAKDAFAGDHSQ
jgi:hypothetical protein